MRIVLAIQGITDAASPRHAVVADHAAETDIAFADMLEAGVRHSGHDGERLQHDRGGAAMARPERYRDDFIAILLSHGIGMGLVLKGELFTGTHSSGGEFGHMIHRPDGALCRCGRRGCVEAYAGNYAIWRSARRMSEDAEPVADVGDADMRGARRTARATATARSAKPIARPARRSASASAACSR